MDSSNEPSEKPTEKLWTGPSWMSAINAAMELESIPPLSRTPIGTSLISSSRTAVRTRLRSSSDSLDSSVELGVVERLDAHAIAAQKQPPARPVPNGEGEHAVEPLNQIVTPLLVGVSKDLGVGAAFEAVAVANQLLAKLRKVVQFAVQDDLDRPILVAKRLVPASDVDDAQTTRAESDVRRGEQPIVVRASMDHSGAHGQNGRAIARPAVTADNARDATHAEAAASYHIVRPNPPTPFLKGTGEAELRWKSGRTSGVGWSKSCEPRASRTTVSWHSSGGSRANSSYQRASAISPTATRLCR